MEEKVIEVRVDVGGAVALEAQVEALSRALGQLKAALLAALAPVAGAVLPTITRMVYAAAEAVRFLGGILRALLGSDQGLDSVAQSAQSAQTALTSAAKTVRRTLASFDQLERLGSVDTTAAVSGTGSAETVEQVRTELEELSLWQRLVLSKLEYLMEPLRSIDLSGVTQAFEKLRQAVEPITRSLFAGLEWAWFNLLVPLAGWTAESFAPVFLELLAQALSVLGSVIEAVKPLALWLWENLLRPIAQWTGGVIVSVMEALAQKLGALSVWIQNNQGLVQAMTVVLAAFLAVWAGSKLAGWLTQAQGLPTFFTALKSVVSAVSTAVSLLCTGLQTLLGLAGSGWSAAAAGFRAGANGIIGFLNKLISSVTAGINTMLSGLNRLRIQIPSWVPVLGGESLGFQLPLLSAARIPALAQGAVLPANQPFLALVGDQKHGTNVEAPLSTIQEAVALVMEDQTAAILAGFEASVGVQREILEAVLGIQIGDDVIGQAAARWEHRRSAARGGA